MMTLAAVVRCVGVNETPGRGSRMSRISISRVVVFLVFFVSALVNFPRFFQQTATEVIGHCFTGLSLWSWGLTDFGRSHISQEIIPWAVFGVSHALPFLVLSISLLVLCSFT